MDQHVAAYKGDLSCIQQLVTIDNVNEPDEEMRTLLHRACEGEHPHIVAWLLRLGAKVNVRDLYGYTPLHWAIQKDSRCVLLLLDAGADAEASNNEGNIPLHYVQSVAECMKLLTANPAGVFAVNMDGRTPLHSCASECEAAEVCRLLLEAGSSVDAFDKSGRTPLCEALRHNFRSHAEVLLDHGARLELVKLDRWFQEVPEWAVAHRKYCRSCLALARRRNIIWGNRQESGRERHSLWIALLMCFAPAFLLMVVLMNDFFFFFEVPSL